MLTRLRRRGLRPALPGIILSNVCSIANKMDELRSLIRNSKDFRETSAFVFTETHLSPGVPDAVVELQGFTMYRANRDFSVVQKKKGG